MTPNLYSRVGRTTNPFSRPPSRPGTGTSESASFHTVDNQDEPQPKPIDIKMTAPYKIEPETETQLPNPEPESESEPEPELITIMTTPPVQTAMNVDHEGKSYLKKPKPFNGN